MNKKNTILVVALSVIITLGVSISVQSIIAAWVAPGETPPGGNVAAPINIGSTDQVKDGSFRTKKNLTSDGITHAKGGLIIETRTSAPASPAKGRMWLED